MAAPALPGALETKDHRLPSRATATRNIRCDRRHDSPLSHEMISLRSACATRSPTMTHDYLVLHKKTSRRDEMVGPRRTCWRCAAISSDFLVSRIFPACFSPASRFLSRVLSILADRNALNLEAIEKERGRKKPACLWGTSRRVTQSHIVTQRHAVLQF